MRWISTFGALGLFLVAGCQSNQNAQVLSPEKFVTATSATAYSTTDTNATAGTNAKPRVIAPGVSISVTVDEDHSLDHTYVVPISGTIDFVPLGRIQAEGLTADEVAQKIKQGLEKDYFQKATVIVTIESPLAAAGNGTGGVIYVIGNVNRPGPLLLPKDERFTVTKAIIAAGNFATFANGGKVQLIRYDKTGKKFVTYIDVDRIMKRGEFEKDLQVQDGDWIIVPEKLINF
ncbi:MAG TPA: polysaccharide biosynthesis/export family protein [Verrucomicrobiae bacterium]|nr:polysaccharide biosynthesis/export family protein [Verrucomicrobiae bacterium]